MAEGMVPIWLHYGGKVVQGPEGVDYEGGTVQIYMANRSVSMRELQLHIYSMTGWDPLLSDVAVNGRYQAGGSARYFVLMPIASDTVLRWLIETLLGERSNWTVVQLYLETVPRNGSSSCGNGSFDSLRPGNVSETIPFDICMRGGRCPVNLNRSLVELNREKRREFELSKNIPEAQCLRSGMILLKTFIKHTDQVKIVEVCRKLGTGTGGFYTPGYRNGCKMHLQRMCLGKNWDPDSRLYEDRRSFDGTNPPEIPGDFKKLVEDAIQASHDFLRQNGKAINVEKELPNMSPDICIVNLYDNDGRLGLHQDKDESSRSLMSGLPVVSFSLGDTAEFIYGDRRGVDSAERVELESGDVLIFGGKSRHVFHGVSNIRANTAPERLIEETTLRQGRLNLTFRQY